MMAAAETERRVHLRGIASAWLVLGLLAGSLLTAILLLRGAQSSQGWVRHTLEVRNNLTRIGQGVLASESGQRGYLLTRDERYLSLYRAELRMIHGVLGRAMALTADNPAQQQRLRALAVMLAEKLAELQATIDLAAAGRWDAARAVVVTDGGRQLTETMLGALAELDAEELRLLAVREARANHQRDLSTLALVLALLAAAAAAALEAHRQNAALRLVRDANAELDARVHERTQSLEQSLKLNRALTEEVHHRAGNGLTLVASFLSLQASELEGEAADALDEARRRVVALASAQRRLRVDSSIGSADLVPYLGSILDDIRAAAGAEVTMFYEAPAQPVVEPSGIAVSIGVIAGEMITNAIKHAFPRGMRGQLRLRLKVDGERLHIEVEDDGVGPAPATTEGLGARVLPALAELLGGTLERGPASADAARPGMLCRLTIPASPPHAGS